MSEVVNQSLTPFGDRVVVQILTESRQRASKIFLPQGARVRYDAPLVAKVIDCGPAVEEVQAGMVVLVLAHHDGVEVTIPGLGSYRVIGERACLANLEAPAELGDNELAKRHAALSLKIQERMNKQSLAGSSSMADAMIAAASELEPTFSHEVKMGLN